MFKGRYLPNDGSAMIVRNWLAHVRAARDARDLEAYRLREACSCGPKCGCDNSALRQAQAELDRLLTGIPYF